MLFKASGLILLIYFSSNFAPVSFATTESCSSTDLPCDNGQCIQRSDWCDEVDDCDDESDEKYCPTAEDINIVCDKNLHFQCYGGGCIPKMGHCNGYEDCQDASDEICWPGNYEGSIDVNTETVEESVEKALKWLLSQQQHTYSWGEDTSRALISLALAGTVLTNDTVRQLAVQQLSSEIAVNLFRDDGKISLYRLAQYVKALIATCQNPYNFHGFNLVHILRTRTNKILEKQFVGPSIFLALCLANQTRPKDFRVVHKMSWSMMNHNRNHNGKLYDLEAYSAIASSCMLKSSTYDNAELFRDLLNKTFTSYFYSYKDADVYKIALLLQALNAWSSDPKFGPLTYERNQLMTSLLKKQHEDGSFGDLLATYFALPAIQGKSFGNLQDIKCWKSRLSHLSIHEYSLHRNEILFNVDISLWVTSNYGTEINCMKFSVGHNWTLFDAMRLAKNKNPLYRFDYEETETGKVVYSISDLPNDAEKKMYWNLYINKVNNTDFIRGLTLENIFSRKPTITPYIYGMESYRLRNADNIVFWYRPVN